MHPEECVFDRGRLFGVFRHHAGADSSEEPSDFLEDPLVRRLVPRIPERGALDHPLQDSLSRFAQRQGSGCELPTEEVHCLGDVGGEKDTHVVAPVSVVDLTK